MSITGLLLTEPSTARSWLEEGAACSCSKAQSPAKEHGKASPKAVLCNAMPCRPLVKVGLVHEAVSIAKARWSASLVRWTQSRTSLGSVLKFAGWLAGSGGLPRPRR